MTTTRAPGKIIPLAFPGITPDEVGALMKNTVLNNYPAGTVLCHENELEDTFYLVLEGQVEVTKVINNTEKRLLKVLGPGDFFGEMALVHDSPRAATVTTVSPIIVLELSRESFNNVLRSSPSISLAMVREISRRLRENDEMAIDDLRMRASELAKAYQKMAEMEAARREFLTDIAHHLRTPLMAAGGFLQMLQKGVLPAEKIPPTIETIAKNVQQIASLVNDILFVQEMDLILEQFEPVNLVDLIRRVTGQYQGKAQARNIRFHIKPDLLVPMVKGDPVGLERAFTSIIDNAVKFSPEGGEVEIRIKRKGNSVAVSVRDQGTGISPDVLPHIFDRFYHMDKVGSQLFDGLGIGLAITKQVIQQHKGDIQVESVPGKGSTFTILLTAGKDKDGTENAGTTL